MIKDKASYIKRGIIDPNWVICGDRFVPQGSKSHCIINITAIIHTLLLQLSSFSVLLRHNPKWSVRGLYKCDNITLMRQWVLDLIEFLLFF